MSPVENVKDVPVLSLPLGAFAFAVAVAFQEIRAGVAGRNRPAEEGGGGPQGRRQGGDFLPQTLGTILCALPAGET
jgi:hypothetical protein